MRLRAQTSLMIVISVVFIAIVIIGIYLLNENRHTKEQTRLRELQTNLDIAYRSSIEMYRLATKEAFDLTINTPAVLELFSKGAILQDKEQAKARGELYRLLYPLYQTLGSKSLRQLHFHLNNGESYLRFYEPEHYGDFLWNKRPSIRIAQHEKREVQSFEASSLSLGFHYIYPLFLHKKFLGTMETTISTKMILDALSTLDQAQEYTFLVSKESVSSILFPEQRYLYRDSILNPFFLTEDIEAKLPDSPKPLSANTQQINLMLAHNTALAEALQQGKSFGIFTSLYQQTFAVTFLPMLGIEGRVDGYLVAYQRDDTPQLLRRDFLISIGLNILGAIIITGLLLILVQRTRLIDQERNALKVITDTMLEGMYTVDEEGKIRHINARALEILGYTYKELIGKEAHSIFHSHSLNQHVTLHECPLFIAFQEGKAFSSEEQFFTCKNTHIIPVEIHGQPLFKEDTVIGMVTTFRDLSGKRASDAKMKLLYHALETTNNAVIITNKDAFIEWANPAFSSLTGYSIAETIGKKPSELVRSGEQDQLFYEQMWETILDKKAWHGEIINRKKNGQLYYEELSITSVLDNDNAIEHFVAIKQDISARKKDEDAVHKLAFFDPLTQLPHRRLLIERLEKALSHTKRTHSYSALFFLDIDYFKKINDTYGHAIGDLLLQAVAIRLRSSIRHEDTLSRFGGDEFVILIEDLDTTPEEAALHCKTIAKAIHTAMLQPFELENHLYPITVSIGITLFYGNEVSKENILKHADMALYKAKASGRNRTHFYDNHMQMALELRTRLEDDIYFALTDKQFVLYYQPKLDDKRAITGAELLLRWQHPIHGLILPHEFLPIAQDLRLIKHIGMFVLEHASEQLQEWNTSSTSHLGLSVNISAQELEQEDFVLMLLGFFDANHDDLKRLTLEISEATILKANPYISTVIQTLHSHGVKFSIDNFGAGYVSLSLLKTLPIDEVKIDKSLIKALDGTEGATSIINAMMAIGESFGLHTVADGIETSVQMDTLIDEGCDAFQGFLLGKPLPFELFSKLLNIQHT